MVLFDEFLGVGRGEVIPYFLALYFPGRSVSDLGFFSFSCSTICKSGMLYPLVGRDLMHHQPKCFFK